MRVMPLLTTKRLRTTLPALPISTLAAFLLASVALAAPGDRISTADFDLAPDNGGADGIAWDGTHYRVVDNIDDKVYSYTSSGAYAPSADFDLVPENVYATGITWDGTYYRVVGASPLPHHPYPSFPRKRE